MGQLYKNQKKKMTNIFGKYKTIHLNGICLLLFGKKNL